VKPKEAARKHALKNRQEFGEASVDAVTGSTFQDADGSPEEIQQAAESAVEEVNSLSDAQVEEEMQEFDYEEQEHEHDPLPDLEGADDSEVVVRFAPNPNGPPHLGSARGMVVNGELAEKYDGKLVLRFDDTDPRNKRPRRSGYESYPEMFEWLGYEVDEVVKSSKQFEKYYSHADELVEAGKAYICECSAEKGREYRRGGEACPHRDRPTSENTELWNEMKDGEISEGEATLKIKTEVDHKNPAIRDFVAFRIIENPDHPVTGNQYSAWPLLDFAGAIEDHYTETTHIVRGKDLRASTKRQKYIYNYLDWEYPEVRYWGDVQISGFEAPMSTSTLGEMVDSGELEGWDDPRAPTLTALKKRGFQPEALRNFFVDMGVTENEVEASLDTLKTENRRIVEENNRAFFVRNPVELEIRDAPGTLEAEIPRHPDHPERGNRRFELDSEDSGITVVIEPSDLEGGFLRLKGLCNIQLKGDEAEYIGDDYRAASERDAPVIHWLPPDSRQSTVQMPDGSKQHGKVERSIEDGEIVQFERFGFARKSKDGKLYYTHG
jgi:glutamyl-tRNA synthetase